MLEQDFLKALKSTVDKVGFDLGQIQAPPLEFVDLDNTVKAQEMFDSQDDYLIWEMLTLTDDPRDPLYTATFNIGARTVNDPANYDILTLAGKVKAIFKIGQRIDIYDYTGTVVSSKGGSMIPIDVSVMTQQYERVSGVRMITVTAKAQRIV